jgi:glycerate dehydrogenase
MKIVVLDGFTANPGDLSYEGLKPLGDVVIHDRTPESEVCERLQGAEAVLTNKAIVSASTIEKTPSLRYIGVVATGYNNVDVAAARARGIPVCNVPEYGTYTVAQATFSLLLELTNHAGHHSQAVRGGRWSTSKDFCFWDGSLLELSGLTLGVIGYGRIGQAVARIGQAFGMKVLACRRGPVEGAERADLERVFRESDVITLHCPLTPDTKELIRESNLALMKSSALLINTSRGGLVNERDLAKALNEGRIAGAGLDVLSVEPPPPDHPLLNAKNCLVTPHIAWATRAARARLIQASIENLRAFQSGTPQNVVNR